MTQYELGKRSKVRDIYFIIWDGLLNDKEHFYVALNGFKKAFYQFSLVYISALFIVIFISSSIALILRKLYIQVFVLFPFLMGILGLVKNDILNYNLAYHLNKYYDIYSIIFGFLFFYWFYIIYERSKIKS